MRVLREYERGVVFRLGRLLEPEGPGPDPAGPAHRSDGAREPAHGDAADPAAGGDHARQRAGAGHRRRLLPVVDPTKAVLEVEDVLAATSQIAQTTLRSVLGKAELDELLAERERLNEHLQQIIDDQTEPWGIKVTAVEIKDVEIPERMQHAIARQAEAERERRAKIINAEGEFQAAARLAEAADVIARNPVAIQLRYLQTLMEVGGNQNSTIVLPLPMDALRPLVGAAQTSSSEIAEGRQREQVDEALAAAQASLDAADATSVQLESGVDQAPVEQNGEPAARGA